MANEPIRSIGLSADGRKLQLLGSTVFYEFDYTGAPLWTTPASEAASEARIIAAIKAGGGGTPIGAGIPTGTPLPTGGTPQPVTVSPPPITVPVSATPGKDTITVLLSGDATTTNPHVDIFIDGRRVEANHEIVIIRGTPRVYTNHSEPVTFVVDASPSHEIGLTFLDDAYGGTAQTDKNAYLDGAYCNGEWFPTAKLDLAGPSNQHLATSITKGQGVPPSGGGTGGTGGSSSSTTGTGGTTSGSSTGGATASGGGSSPAATGATVNVGPTRAIKELADALAGLPPNSTVLLDPGTYRKPSVLTAPGLTVRAASGTGRECVFDGQGGFGGGHRLAEGKGMLIPQAPCTIGPGLSFVNCGSPASGPSYSNEAGIWIELDGPGLVTITRCAFNGNANGVFCPRLDGVKVLLDGNVYGDKVPNGLNGTVTGNAIGSAHDNYIQCDELEVRGNYFYGCANGHNVHSRAIVTNMHDNPCTASDGGRVLDVSDGGTMHFDRNVVFTRTDESGRTIPPGLAAFMFGNANVIGYATESTNRGTQGGTIDGNTWHITRGGATVWIAAGTVTATGNQANCYGQGSLAITGSGTLSGLSAQTAPGSAPALPAPPF